jgi:hypothetical protein
MRFGMYIVTLCVVLAVSAASKSGRARDFHSPEERPIDGTAFTPAEGQARLVVGLFGVSETDLLAAIGISYAPSRFFNIGANLAHMGVGILNVNSKFNIIDKGNFGLGAKLGFMYVNGGWVWVLPDRLKELLSGVNTFVIPVSVIMSVDITRCLHLDLGVGYIHTEVLGSLDEGNLVYDGYLAARRISADASLRYYVSERVALHGYFFTPIWGKRYRQWDADVTITEGLHGGVRTAGFKTIRPLDQWLLLLSLDVELARLVYLKMIFSIGPKTEYVYEKRVQMGAGFEWRF